ncbi:MAG: TonB-dependent receptor [Acidobacteriota bacterium]|nr:TonB-dependent receptor [Acidobacteriota bacterium]
MHLRKRTAVASMLLCSSAVFAQAPRVMEGVVHDPQHHPLRGAVVTLECDASEAKKTVESDANGEFEFTGLPQSSCTVTANAKSFRPQEQQVSLAEKTPVIHFQLELARITQSVEVSASRLDTQISTPRSVTSSQEIAETAGADQTNSLQMITAFVPGAYMVHDMLHMRGGHQVNWFFDGIPVINTNIAANVAPLINPKNVDELETERVGFSSAYGNRTYGFFNVVTPSGFNRDNQAELITSFGNFYSTDDQFNIGGHTQRFAYYASVDANRSQLGLSNPTSAVIHDQESGTGGFVSLLYNPTPKDQLRWIGSLRGDHYQVPNTPEDQESGIRDLNIERDYLVGFNWTHTISEGSLFSIAPYFHHNSANYLGGSADTPFVLNDDDRSDYFGGRAVLQVQKKKHSARTGVEIWGERDRPFFGLTENPGTQTIAQQQLHWANSNAFFIEDQYKATSWLTLDLGLRLTHYGGLVNENAADPRLGAAIRIPRLNWILRGYYAYYYQPPPLNSVSGPLLQFAFAQGFGFTPLKGERDIQHDIGLTVPFRGWSVDIDNFHTSVRNFLDHDVLGNSGIFVPLTDLGALISGTEIALRSSDIAHVGRLRIAYSNQIAEGVGPITGGLLEAADFGRFLLDHDQCNTLSAVFSMRLPRGIWATPAYSFGSGFLDWNGPAHLQPHSTVDLSIGKRFGENWSASINAVNVGNARYQIDDSNTFGGTHFVNPRQIYGELRFRFHL